MPQPSTGPTDLPPDAAEVSRLIAKGNSKSAVEAAKVIHKRCGTPATEALLVDAYCARVRSMLDSRFTAEAEALVAMVRQKYPSSAGRLERLREVMVTAGAGLDEMLRPLSDPSASAEAKAAAETLVRTTLVDLALLAECRALASDHPLRRGADAIRRAMDVVTSGPVDDSVLALPEISRRSPLASWKPLLRAIACYYRYEDTAGREHLETIDPDSAPARLKPALAALLGAGDLRTLTPAATTLAKAVRGDLDELRVSLAGLDRAFEREHVPHILSGVRTALALAQHECPEIIDALRRHVAVRAMVDDIDPAPLTAAMGGRPKDDARFLLMLARALETTLDNPVLACHYWDQFRRAAVHEKWFPARGPEVSTLYLHMAGLAANADEDDLAEEYRQLREMLWRDAAEGSSAELPAMEYLHPEWLMEQACAMDPNPAAFLSWVEWALGGKAGSVEAAAEAWRKALPNDPRPLIVLMEQAEQRNALKKAMGFLRQAESIDGVNADVRRARLRLLILGAIRHIKQGKTHLAEAELAELEVLPQARENGRLAFVAALRAVAAFSSGDAKAWEAHVLKAGQLLGNPLAGAMVTAGAATLCGVRLGVKDKDVEEGWIVAVCRAFALGSDLGFTFLIPEVWAAPILAELRHRRVADPSLLESLCLIALRQPMVEVAFETTAAGLLLAKGSEARFLLLRAKVLPPMQYVRTEDCLRAAAALARKNNDAVLGAEVRQRWSQITIAGSMGMDVPAMSHREAERFLGRERKAAYYAEMPFVEEFDDPFDLPFPRRRRRGPRPPPPTPRVPPHDKKTV